MARRRRSYFPGGFFHITARTQGKQPWFDATVRDSICDTISVVQQRCDASITAFAVMPNHLHVVLQQGSDPISRFMQPLLTKIAMTVRKKYELEGHVFGRRYWEHPCNSTEYLRTCIHYVHQNPVKASLCESMEDYKWSSCAYYLEQRRTTSVVITPVNDALVHAIGLSAVCAHDADDDRVYHDMTNVVGFVLRQFEPPIDVDVLRIARGRTAARIRAECIREASRAGFRNSQIAAYLKVSQAVVSKIVVELRRNHRINAAYANRTKIEGETQAQKNRAAEAALFPRLLPKVSPLSDRSPR